MSKISRLLKVLREKRHMTSSELAEKLGVTEAEIVSWEKGKKLPSEDALIALSGVLEISSTDFLSYMVLEDLQRRKKRLVGTIVAIALVILFVLGIIFIPRLCHMVYMDRVEAGYYFADLRGSKNSVNDRAETVTMVQLLTTPERYHGKLVRVKGVGNLEFESNCLWLSKEDLAYYTDQHLWIRFGERAISYEEAQAYNGKYVIVEGIFNMYGGVRGRNYFGAIEEVSRYDLTWKELENPD